MSIYCKQAGEGEALLLIHGLFGSLENLGSLSRAFSQHYKVYSLDLPNHGRSAHTGHISLPLLAEAVVKWMAEHKVEQANIVGHSLGGKTAMEIALLHPERVNKLAVLDIAPVPYSAHHNDVFAGMLAIDPDKIETRQDAESILAEYVHEPAVRSFLLKNLQRREGKFSWRINLPVIHRDYDNILMGNSEGVFKGPVQFIKGVKSDYISEDHRHAIKSRFPDTKFKIISGTGHWLHAEKPELVAKSILKFLDSSL